MSSIDTETQLRAEQIFQEFLKTETSNYATLWEKAIEQAIAEKTAKDKQKPPKVSEADVELAKEYGITDPRVMETIREIRKAKLPSIKEGQPEKRVYVPVVLETEIVNRTPNVVQENSLLVTDWTELSPEQREAEIERQKAEAAEKLRSQIVIEATETYNVVFGVSSPTTAFPIPTLAEVRAKAEKEFSIEELKNALASLDSQIIGFKEAKEARRKVAEGDQRSMYGFPDNPAQKVKIASEVEDVMAGYGDAFDKMEKAIPYYEEIRVMYQQVLEEKEKAATEQQEKLPKILHKMSKLSSEADRLYAKVEKANTEYQERQNENAMNSLAVLIEEYVELQSQWMDCKREVHLLDTQPSMPSIRDLPVLPYKVWKKLRQANP